MITNFIDNHLSQIEKFTKLNQESEKSSESENYSIGIDNDNDNDIDKNKKKYEKEYDYENFNNENKNNFNEFLCTYDISDKNKFAPLNRTKKTESSKSINNHLKKEELSKIII
jgi:hypothetical protein